MGMPLILAVAVAAIVLSGGGENASQPASDDRRQAQEGGNQNADLGTPALGSADAPVVLTEYSDYQ